MSVLEVEEREAWDRVVRLPMPMPHTLDVLNDPSRFKVLVCGRRWGKTWTMRTAALDGHGPGLRRRGALHGGYVWWVMPTLPAARDTWDALCEHLKDAWVRRNATERFFDLPGGGRLQVKSADQPDSLRGPGLAGVVLDETKDILTSTWRSVLRATLATTNGWLLAGGTPGDEDESSLIYYLFRRAENRGGWRAWQRPTSDNQLVTPAELLDLEDELGPAFGRECLAQFTSSGGGRFKRAWIRYYEQGLENVSLGGDSIPLASLRIFICADLAATVKTSSDYSAMGVFGLAPDGRLLVLDVVRAKLEAPDVLVNLRALVTRWTRGGLAPRIHVEATAYNNLFVGLARAQGLPVEAVTVDRDKVQRAEAAVAGMEAGRIWLPRGATWASAFVDELATFPDGTHDDQVDILSAAVAVAWRKLPRSDYSGWDPKTPSGPRFGGLGGRFSGR